MADDAVRIVYLLGMARSGSTVLDIALGNHPEMLAVGELENLPGAGWSKGELCACGSPGDRCAFWSEVRRAWNARLGRDDVAGYLALQERFTRPRRFHPVPAHLRREAHAPSEAFRSFADGTRALYEAIADISGRRIIVDSSKYPPRAYALALIRGLDVRFVHLVRDGRAVAWSLAKAYRKDVAAGIPTDMAPISTLWSSRSWLSINRACEDVLRESGAPSLRLRYEDFVQTPRAMLVGIGTLLDLDLSALGDRLERGAVLDAGHVIAGNRVRLEGPVRLALDESWRREMPLARRGLFWLLAGRLARRYGYAWA